MASPELTPATTGVKYEVKGIKKISNGKGCFCCSKKKAKDHTSSDDRVEQLAKSHIAKNEAKQ